MPDESDVIDLDPVVIHTWGDCPGHVVAKACDGRDGFVWLMCSECATRFGSVYGAVIEGLNRYVRALAGVSEKITGQVGLTVDGMVSARDYLPYVEVAVGGKRGMLSMAMARQIGADIVQQAARAEADAMILKFFLEEDFPVGAVSALMSKFRDFRKALDGEPVTRSTEEGG